MTTIRTVSELETLYGTPNPGSLKKEISRLTPDYRRWIEAAPFLVIATSGPGGLDCSPRGDAKGQLFNVIDDATLAIPDRRGNNRLDTLRNIVTDPRVALIFLVPGISEGVRINGRAEISTDRQLIERFGVGETTPRTVIVVGIESVYFQCGRAITRARLWDPAAHANRESVPTAGQLMKTAAPNQGS